MQDAPAIHHPIVVIGMGAMGRRIAQELHDTANVRPSGAGFAACLVPDSPRAQAALDSGLSDALAQLLEAGAVQGARDGRTRLDLCLVADLQDVDADTLRASCTTISALMARAYGVTFPASAPPDKRSAWLALLLASPALADQAGRDVVDGLASLERWADGAAHPTLSRVWLLPRQTSAGSLSNQAVEQGLRLFAQGLYLSGVRDHDAVRSLLQHRADQRLIASISVAAAELPVARLRRYARWRAALDGFNTLVQQAEQPNADAARAESLLTELDPRALLQPWHAERGEPAVRLLQHAGRLSGGHQRLPQHFSVRIAEPDQAVRSHYHVLFEKAAKPSPRGSADAPDHQDVLRVLDHAEAQALHGAHQRIDRLLSEQLDPDAVLNKLPAVESSLDRAIHLLDTELRAEVPMLPAIEPPPPPRDPGLLALEAALASRPEPKHLIGVTLAMAGVLAVCGALAAWWLLEPASSAVVSLPAAGFSSQPSVAPATAPSWQAVLPVVGGALLGVALAAGWLGVVLHRARRALEAQLEVRRAELELLWDTGGGGQEREMALALLAVRRRRVAAAMRRLFVHARRRTTALRAALRQARDGAQRQLSDLGVILGDEPDDDDLSGLIGDDTPLHRTLLPARLVSRRIAEARVKRDPHDWARHLVRAIWPTDGLASDLPATEGPRVEAAADSQYPQLGAAQLLDGPGLRAQLDDHLRRFLSGVDAALAHGISPRDTYDNPVRGAGTDQRVVIAPIDLRATVEAGLADARSHDHAWGASNTPWVVVLSSWQGFRAEELARGIRGSR